MPITEKASFAQAGCRTRAHFLDASTLLEGAEVIAPCVGFRGFECNRLITEVTARQHPTREHLSGYCTFAYSALASRIANGRRWIGGENEYLDSWLKPVHPNV